MFEANFLEGIKALYLWVTLCSEALVFLKEQFKNFFTFLVSFLLICFFYPISV